MPSLRAVSHSCQVCISSSILIPFSVYAFGELSRSLCVGGGRGCWGVGGLCLFVAFGLRFLSSLVCVFCLVWFAFFV